MLYLSSLFQERYPKIFLGIAKHIPTQQIPNTKDIWLRDFMPIKNTSNEWVLFRYYPKYLRNKKYQSLISDNQNICNKLNIQYMQSSIILDGGSVVHKNNIYFVSERVLQDNPKLSKVDVLSALEHTFKTDHIILIPEAPNDFTGHLDGVLSILNAQTILVNNYLDDYSKLLHKRLNTYHFNIEQLPYNPYSNKTYQSAQGIYINFIETDSLLIVPIFNQKEDESALLKLSQCFPKLSIIPILCNDLAKEGGLLHCISWQD